MNEGTGRRETSARSPFVCEVRAARRTGGFHTTQVVDADTGEGPGGLLGAAIQVRVQGRIAA